MLSSIASFLFGGEKRQEVEDSVDLEMKEDDEWLLVNISSKTEIDHVNDEYDDCDNPDETFQPVPYTLPLETMPTSTTNSLQINLPQYEDSWLITPSSCLVSEIVEERSIHILPIEKLVLEHPVVSLYKAALLYAFPENCMNVDCRVHLACDPKTVSCLDVKVVKQLQPSNIENCRLVLNSSTKTKSQKFDKKVVNNAKLPKPVIENSSSPLLKTELLQQIKVLRPSQAAKEFQIRKFFGRSQLKRQNQCYIYESSAKNRRRKDLWQHNSGANNNRKCC